MLSQRQKKRTRYYGGVTERLARGEAGPNQSPWVRYNVQRRQEQAREASASSQALQRHKHRMLSKGVVEAVRGDGVSAALSIPCPWV